MTAHPTVLFIAGLVLTASSVIAAPTTCRLWSIGCSPNVVVGSALLTTVYASIVGLSLSVVVMALRLLRQKRAGRTVLAVASLFLSIGLGASVGSKVMTDVVLQGRGYYTRYGKQLRHCTEWSRSFSQDAFDRIRVGLKEAELTDVLGPPLHVARHEEQSLHVYTRHGPYHSFADKGWHLRAVLVQAGNVKAVLERYALVDEVDYYPSVPVRPASSQ